jgi:hypothetical protein
MVAVRRNEESWFGLFEYFSNNPAGETDENHENLFSS